MSTTPGHLAHSAAPRLLAQPCAGHRDAELVSDGESARPQEITHTLSYKWAGAVMQGAGHLRASDGRP